MGILTAWTSKQRTSPATKKDSHHRKYYPKMDSFPNIWMHQEDAISLNSQYTKQILVKGNTQIHTYSGDVNNCLFTMCKTRRQSIKI